MALRNVFLACFAFVMCICVCVCAITTLVVINEESNPKQSPIPTPTPTLTPTPTTIYDDYAKIQRAVDNFRWRYNNFQGWNFIIITTVRINKVVNISSNELGSNNDEIILAEFYDDSNTCLLYTSPSPRDRG